MLTLNTIEWLAGRLPILRRLTKAHEELERMRDEMDVLKSRIDVPDELFDQFQRERATHMYQSIYDLPNPLVTVCIATYNRGSLLVERSIKSILAQDYTNLEIIVVGDGCTDDTVQLLEQMRDERLRFVNLPERGSYPDKPEWRWMVAGTAAVNHALTLARGDFITHLDDDDEHQSDRVRKLLRFTQETRADFVWHPFWWETAAGAWRLKNAEHFRYREVTTSSIFYHNWLKRIPWDGNAYRYREPGDWNRFRKFKYLGVNAMRYPEPLLRHYKERNQAHR